MDRNNMRSNYVNSGPRSLPHMGGKRHNGNGHNSSRLSPPAQSNNNNNTNSNNSQHDDLINYVFESWNKVNREVEKGGDDAKYFQPGLPPAQMANFRPFNLEEWWGRRVIQSINRNKHRSS